MLADIAAEVAEGSATGTQHQVVDHVSSFPMRAYLDPVEAQLKAERWRQILQVARQRPSSCVAALVRAIVADGATSAAALSAARVVAPGAGRLNITQPLDADYVGAELSVLRTPASYDASLRLAYALIRYDLDLASSQAAHAIAVGADRHEPYLCQARVCMAADRPCEALGFFDDAHTRGWREQRHEWAAAANRCGDPQEALRIAAEAGLASTPELVLECARAHRLMGDTAQATQAYRRCLGERVQEEVRLAAAAELAECYLAQGLWREAIRQASEPAARGHPPAERTVGLSHYAAGEHVPAAAHLERYVDSTPEDQEAWRYLAFALLATGQHDAAARAADTALRLDDTDGQAVRARAQALLRGGDYARLAEVIELGERGILSRSEIAHFLIEWGRLAQAAEFLNGWIAGRPHDSAAWVYLGYLSERVADPDGALHYYREALRRDPGNEFVRTRAYRLQYVVESSDAADADNRDALLRAE